MKVAALILTMFLAAVSAAGQVASLKNDIPESQYLAAEAKGEALLKTANYRSVWMKEHSEGSGKPATLQAKKLHEVIQPKKWRTVEEKFDDQPSRAEIIADGKASYFRINDGPWTKGELGSSIFDRNESGQVENKYIYYSGLDFAGIEYDFYQHISIRTAKKFTGTDFAVLRYIQTTGVSYSKKGQVLRKVTETVIEGREEMVRETTRYEYDPKDLKIEAPVK